MERKAKKDNETVVCDDLEKLLKDGCEVRKVTLVQLFLELSNGVTQKIDERWEDWMSLDYELWKKKNEGEQKIDLHTRWTYLREMLHRKGIDTSNHRQLLTISSGRKTEERNLEISIGSPDKGLVVINRLELDGHVSLPRQTVSGLLCFQRKDAFLIYNPVTGERSRWIPTSKPGGKIAFGFNPQSNEHKVICISGNKGGSGQVVDIFTIGKEAWTRIEAEPPIYVGDQDPFYVAGCLYWRLRVPNTWEMGKGKQEHMLIFDIATEKFRVVEIPNYVVNMKRNKWPQTVELTELDGCIAVLYWTHELSITLVTMHEAADGTIKWKDNKIDMPPQWDVKLDISIEALTGTNQIFIRYEDSKFFFYYNRATKESLRFPVLPNECFWRRTMQL